MVGLLILAAIVFILWILGWLAFHIAGAFIHILLIVAIVVLVIGLITGRKTA